MISRAIARFNRISPRKTRLVADAVRGKGVDEARAILMNLNKRPCLYVKEVLDSAVANAARNPDILPGDLRISKITIDGGPMLKRYRAGSMGRAMMIRHRMSHIIVELDLKKPVVKTPAETQKGERLKVKGKREDVKKRVRYKEAKAKVKKLVASGRGK